MRQLALDDAAPEADVGVYEEGLAVDVAKAQRLFASGCVRGRSTERLSVMMGCEIKPGSTSGLSVMVASSVSSISPRRRCCSSRDSEATMVPGVVSTTSCVTRQSGAGAQVPILSVRRRVSSEDSSSRMRR